MVTRTHILIYIIIVIIIIIIIIVITIAEGFTTLKALVQWLERRNLTPEDPGVDPLVEQGEGQFLHPSESTLVQTCLYLIPFMCVRKPAQCVRMSKNPSISEAYTLEQTSAEVSRGINT